MSTTTSNTIARPTAVDIDALWDSLSAFSRGTTTPNALFGALVAAIAEHEQQTAALALAVLRVDEKIDALTALAARIDELQGGVAAGQEAMRRVDLAANGMTEDTIDPDWSEADEARYQAEVPDGIVVHAYHV